MKHPPRGWPRISSSLFYDDAPAAIDFLCRAFGFEVRLKVEGEGGRIEHSELTFADDGLVMVSSTGREREGRAAMPGVSPQSVDGRITQTLCVYLDEVDKHCEHARSAGARILDEPFTTDYGDDYWEDRSYRVLDTEGHHWWFVQRMREQNAG
ncbi:MAG: VOC family protein [Candidatus Eisenbacteria bacterium]|uniref:VOC family protein n=1 Tax=Eiseniibacteriota bacterium TaxID=2212470 RepID=A0A956RPB2_UNCEI|nr:VOC family protein [Candidatus Eisenbacteria bacterium]